MTRMNRDAMLVSSLLRGDAASSDDASTLADQRVSCCNAQGDTSTVKAVVLTRPLWANCRNIR